MFASGPATTLATGYDDVLDRPLDEAVITWQGSLFGFDDPSFDPSVAGAERIWLDELSWVDHRSAWLNGADHVFSDLVARLPWRQRRVPMYGRMVDEPRLTWWWDAKASAGQERGADALCVDVLEQMRVALSRHYDEEFDSVGCNLYRNGTDSVAWHGDKIDDRAEPLVAIVSVGAPRPFQLRPAGGGHAMSFLLGQGDLLVMGGACQRAWEHCVPKVAAAGPRLSITYRHEAAFTRARNRSQLDLLMTRHHPSAWKRA